MYSFLRSFLFLFPPEWVHYFSMNGLRFLRLIGLRKLFVALYCSRNSKSIEFSGLIFPNPVGLGAGFDKNARYLDELEMLGFGFVEIGTVTPLPQAGNDKPRLFRLPKDKALINRMGFNNDGVEKVAQRLSNRLLKIASKQKVRNREPGEGNSRLRMLVGGNIGKNKNTPNEEAWRDYEICFSALHDYVDYFVVNVSSPNTPGLRELQEKSSLKKILTRLQDINQQRQVQRPLLLKISPDLSNEQIDAVIDLALEIKLDGLVVANTTISRQGLATDDKKIRSIGAGGLSGKPLKERSTDLVKYICNKSGSKIPIVASGGIFIPADAQEKIAAGASLVQVWTSFVYEGPGIVKRISKFF